MRIGGIRARGSLISIEWPASIRRSWGEASRTRVEGAPGVPRKTQTRNAQRQGAPTVPASETRGRDGRLDRAWRSRNGLVTCATQFQARGLYG